MMKTHKTHQKVHIPRGFEAFRQGDILSFSLDGLLPPRAILALHATYGTLSYLVGEGNRPLLKCEEQFTTAELSILLPILLCYPKHAPYELVYASFYDGDIKESVVAKSRKRLQAIETAEEWAQEMRLVQGTFGKVRAKLSVFALEVLTIFNQGYLLVGIQEEKETP